VVVFQPVHGGVFAALDGGQLTLSGSTLNNVAVSASARVWGGVALAARGTVTMEASAVDLVHVHSSSGIVDPSETRAWFGRGVFGGVLHLQAGATGTLRTNMKIQYVHVRGVASHGGVVYVGEQAAVYCSDITVSSASVCASSPNLAYGTHTPHSQPCPGGATSQLDAVRRGAHDECLLQCTGDEASGAGFYVIGSARMQRSVVSSSSVFSSAATPSVAGGGALFVGSGASVILRDATKFSHNFAPPGRGAAILPLAGSLYYNFPLQQGSWLQNAVRARMHLHLPLPLHAPLLTPPLCRTLGWRGRSCVLLLPSQICSVSREPCPGGKNREANFCRATERACSRTADPSALDLEPAQINASECGPTNAERQHCSSTNCPNGMCMCRTRTLAQPCDWLTYGDELLGQRGQLLPVLLPIDDDVFPYLCAAGIVGSNETRHQSSPECAGRCPAGFKCPSTPTLNPLPCDAGNYCQLGSVNSQPCPEGTFSNMTNLTAASQCRACPSGYVRHISPMPRILGCARHEALVALTGAWLHL
jgi:hypothetical protein